MISLNALLGRPVEYYEYPWAMEGRLRDAQSRFRSLFQPSDVGYIFAKSMPRSGHRFLSECLTHYFGEGGGLGMSLFVFRCIQSRSLMKAPRAWSRSAWI